jgi:hypothetical protein
VKRQRGTGSVFLREDSRIWSYQIFVNGKRERGSTAVKERRKRSFAGNCRTILSVFRPRTVTKPQ